MQYLGGKSRIAKPLTAYLRSRLEGRSFCEPFCGGLSITRNMPGRRLAADANLALITTYRAVKAGWDPPRSVSEEEYRRLRATQDPLDPLTAFVGIGCSFAGKWFAGLCRPSASNPHDYVKGTRASLLRDIGQCAEVVFEHASYNEWDFGPEHLVYCDPPYAQTTGYGACPPFDSAAFWVVAREWAAAGALVLVSEYTAPNDVRCVWSAEVCTQMQCVGKHGRVEKLFEVGASNRNTSGVDSSNPPKCK